ncbi:3-alpha,7-alpha,12-alpha-trihydroxy-5-beta-cholest-24-enoyl-CoA hydratase [Oceanicola sp. 22II-s10i]|uniref:MaoC/PaaZ C-terminal domain-containing protein n=1 Tax=Oceanicola sp. 22II-s10i TaxID=1317116 RepID=UPI000B526CA0|nr:MaoC/PaaZ C-terminal domain-containing protein [Oceanicola sp. 22II-s10i]OWU83734.1 3-alpha,7-alpha,12-alpha-trihydroxy-5-beta-cholest-24-enoyl-CoA hydratase [Oceanicola sp. 22II-s10i]
MAIDYDKLIARAFPEVEQSYTSKDTILYALGIGVGADPLDLDQVRFTFEEAEGFAPLPTMPVVMAGPGFWVREPDSGVTWQQVLHGEQRLTLHNPMPAEGTVVGQTRIEEVIDKGEGKGALIYVAREIHDKATGTHIATSSSTTFARADGGFGGPSGPTKPVHALPDRAADMTDEIRTLPQAALIYRLSGDPNPLHASPSVATEAGFHAPILHGLCSYGVAGWSILRSCCGGDPTRLKQLDLRFSSPVFPGETLRTEIWKDGADISFRTTVVERDKVVLNNGYARVA